MTHHLFAVCACLSVTAVLAQDPTPPAVEPTIIQSAEEKYSSEVAKSEALVAKAETELAKARKLAGEARLKAYKERLMEVTKSGDFDKAVGVKARIEQLEKEPESERPKATKRPRPKDVVKFGGHTYALIKEPATWHVAKQRCEDLGGHLVSVNSAKEETFVIGLCGSNDAWIGATDEEDEGKWNNVDRSVLVIAHVEFDNAKGGEHWLMWDSISKRFNDMNTGVRINYVCEWDRQ